MSRILSSTQQKHSKATSVNATPLPYMRQLDGLRAVAISLVLFSHWFDAFEINFGRYGVRLFFVLSGFLITSILLESDRRRAVTNHSRRSILKQFYIRRFLRIFPLYYAVIGFALLVNIESVDIAKWWHLLYISNIFTAIQGSNIGVSTHFWSLSVEEQFYLLWPWLIILLPRRLILPMIITTIFIGPVFRAVAIELSANAMTVRWQSLACFDSLGLGSLLAWLVFHGDKMRHKLIWLRRWFVIAGLPLMLLTMFLDTSDMVLPDQAWIVVVTDFSAALVGFWIVSKTAEGVSGPVGQLLSNRISVYIGKISYGIYVIHPFMVMFSGILFVRLGINDTIDHRVLPVIWLAATLLVASASWKYFEKPINQLKRHIPYG